MPEKGCTATKHQIKTGSPRKTVAQRAKNFEMLNEHMKVACEPYYYVKVNSINMQPEVRPIYADGIEENKSLLNLVAQFIKESPKHKQEAE